MTGDRVVIDHGDLTTAMRASLSAPGVFAPVEYEGRLLADGGLTSNLPIDVAREMGVDVLIVVDCGFPLMERKKLDSVATVSNQMLAILLRSNSTVQRKTLTDRDVIIDPALGDFSSLDFESHARAMKIGEEAARGASQRLAALGVSDAEYARFNAARIDPTVADRRRKASMSRRPVPRAPRSGSTAAPPWQLLHCRLHACVASVPRARPAASGARVDRQRGAPRPACCVRSLPPRAPKSQSPAHRTVYAVRQPERVP